MCNTTNNFVFFLCVCCCLLVNLLAVCKFGFISGGGISNNQQVFDNYILVSDTGSDEPRHFIKDLHSTNPWFYIHETTKQHLVEFDTLTPTIYIYYIIKTNYYMYLQVPSSLFLWHFYCWKTLNEMWTKIDLVFIPLPILVYAVAY